VFNGSRFRAQIAPRIVAFHAHVDALNRPKGWLRRRAKVRG